MSVEGNVIVEVMGEEGGVESVACGSSKVHVENVEDEESHEELFEVVDGFME